MWHGILRLVTVEGHWCIWSLIKMKLNVIGGYWILWYTGVFQCLWVVWFVLSYVNAPTVQISKKTLQQCTINCEKRYINNTWIECLQCAKQNLTSQEFFNAIQFSSRYFGSYQSYWNAWNPNETFQGFCLQQHLVCINFSRLMHITCTSWNAYASLLSLNTWWL